MEGTLEEFKRNRPKVWGAKQTSYNIAVSLLYHPRGLKENELEKATELEKDRLKEGISRMMEHDNITINEKGIYSLTTECRAWLKKSL